MSNNNSKHNEFETHILYCSNCGEQLSEQMYKRLMNNFSVKCPKCGKEFELELLTGEDLDNLENQRAASRKDGEKKQDQVKGDGVFTGKFKGFGDFTGKLVGGIVHGVKTIEKVTNEIKSAVDENFQQQKAQQQRKQQNPNKQPKNDSFFKRSDKNKRPSNKQNYEIPNNAELYQIISSRNRPLFYLNNFSFSFALIITVISWIMFAIVFAGSIPDLYNQRFYIMKHLIQALGSSFVFLYDTFYVRKKCINFDFLNYGVDYFLIGILFSTPITLYAGIFLAIKGFYIMITNVGNQFIARFFGSKNRGFWEVVLSIMNNYGSLMGLIIIVLDQRVFFMNDMLNSLERIYAIAAIVCLIIDFLILRPIINRKKPKELSFTIPYLKLILGALACFYLLSGIINLVFGIGLVIYRDTYNKIE